MINSDSSVSSTSLTRSLTKVKSKLSSRFKNTTNDDHYENREHVLKAMKYDDFDPINDSNRRTSSHAIQVTDQETTIPKSSSISSTRSSSNIIIAQDLSNLEAPNLNKRGSDSSSSEVHPVSMDEAITQTSRSSLSDQYSNSLNIAALAASNSATASSKITITSSITTNSLNSNPAIPSTIISTPFSASTPSNVPSQAVEEPLLPPPIDTTVCFKGIRVLTPNFELRSPFNTMINGVCDEQKLNILSPPISPKRNESVCFDPLSKLDVLKEDNESIQFEPQPNDYADAMAASILDKVDDSKTSNEWKI